MIQKHENDNWHWISLGSGLGAATLFLLFLYAPNGMWKVVIAILIAITLGLMLWNPRYRLLALGTAAALTGIAGFVTEISFDVSATLPGGGVLSGGVNGGTDVPPVYFMVLFVLGIATVAFDSVGRGWLWSSGQKNDPCQPNLSFILHDNAVELTDQLAEDGNGRFHLSLSVSKGLCCTNR